MPTAHDVQAAAPVDPPTAAEVSAALTVIRRSSLYWAPEVRVRKLLDYLEAYGEPLETLLRAMPDDEREACGIDHVTRKAVPS